MEKTSQEFSLLKQHPIRKQRVILQIGTKKYCDREYTVAQIEDLLNSIGIKCRVTNCMLSGFSRFVVDYGYLEGEDLRSIAGKKYNQVATLEIFISHKCREFVAIILRGMNADILEPSEMQTR